MRGVCTALVGHHHYHSFCLSVNCCFHTHYIMGVLACVCVWVHCVAASCSLFLLRLRASQNFTGAPADYLQYRDTLHTGSSRVLNQSSDVWEKQRGNTGNENSSSESERRTVWRTAYQVLCWATAARKVCVSYWRRDIAVVIPPLTVPSPSPYLLVPATP